MSGTFALSSGYPTTNNRKGLSDLGLSKISFKKPIGLGVWVKLANPAWCKAAISRPVAIPTDSVA